MATNFEKVREFHNVFNHPVRTNATAELFDEEPKLFGLRISLIDEEFNELKDAILKRDRVEIADALSDILYVVYGAGLALGYNLDETFDLVHKSNMTKACKTEQEAIDTVEFIKMQGKYNPTYKQSTDGNYWIVYDYDTGKILKSIYYTPVDLTFVAN